MNETGDAKKNLFKVLSLLEACFDLISGSTLSMKSQIMGGKITEILEFKSPLWKVKIFSFFFLFIFKFFTQKWISFINIWVKNKDMQFFIGEFENEKKKGQNNFDLPDRGFEPQIFSYFPHMIWIFMWCEEPQIKSKQASKRDRTLL